MSSSSRILSAKVDLSTLLSCGLQRTPRLKKELLAPCPLSYLWQWKTAEEGDGSEEWRPCDAEEATLTIPSVQKSYEGQYRCVVYNHTGRQISKPAKLEVRDHPEKQLMQNSILLRL